MTNEIDVQALKEVELTTRLTKAGMTFSYQTYIINYKIWEAAYVVVKEGLPKNIAGRPRETVKGLTTKEMLRVVELYYRDIDLLTMHQMLAPVSINSIFYFLRVDNTPFGYHKCFCGQPFVYVGVGAHVKCATCQKDAELAARVLNVDLNITRRFTKRTIDEAATYNKTFLIDKIRTQLYETCYMKKILADIVQNGWAFLDHVKGDANGGHNDMTACLAQFDSEMNKVRQFVEGYEMIKQQLLPSPSKAKAPARRQPALEKETVLMIH